LIVASGRLALFTLLRQAAEDGTVDVEERMLRRAVDNLRNDARRTQAAEHSAHTTMWRVLHEQILYLYHLQRARDCNWYNLGFAHLNSFVSSSFDSVKIPSSAAVCTSLTK
jgi:hypothetical protein